MAPHGIGSVRRLPEVFDGVGACQAPAGPINHPDHKRLQGARNALDQPDPMAPSAWVAQSAASR